MKSRCHVNRLPVSVTVTGTEKKWSGVTRRNSRTRFSLTASDLRCHWHHFAFRRQQEVSRLRWCATISSLAAVVTENIYFIMVFDLLPNSTGPVYNDAIYHHHQRLEVWGTFGSRHPSCCSHGNRRREGNSDRRYDFPILLLDRNRNKAVGRTVVNRPRSQNSGRECWRCCDSHPRCGLGAYL